MSWRSFGVVVATMLWAAGAKASPSARLVYARDPSAMSCPDEQALRHAVAARVGYDPFFPWAKQTVVVVLSTDGEQYLARVEIVDDANAIHGSRQLRAVGPGCSGLVDAAALAISIALDVAERPRPAPAAPPDIEMPASSPPTVVPGPMFQPSLREGATASPPVHPIHLRPAFGMDALGSAGMAPSASAGFDAFAQLRLGLASVAVEFRFDAPTSESAAGGGRVQGSLLAGGIAPCVHLGPTFGCAVVLLGTLRGRGEDVTSPESQSTLLAATGPRLGVQMPLNRVFEFRVYGETLGNLQRATLYLNNLVAWHAPVLSGTLGIGVVARFP
jgi:hypothetical protein